MCDSRPPGDLRQESADHGAHGGGSRWTAAGRVEKPLQRRDELGLGTSLEPAVPECSSEDDPPPPAKSATRYQSSRESQVEAFVRRSRHVGTYRSWCVVGA